MKKFSFLSAQKRGSGRNALKGGAYALTISAVVLALTVVVNILASALPATLTRFDISASQLYSVTSNTKVVLNSLQKDVTIYWIVQAGEEDSVIDNLLAKYDSLSGHVDVVKKNPDVFPTFAEQYTDETVQNNSLVVVCGERYRYLPYDELYLVTADNVYYDYYYYYGYDVDPDSFDGEGAITSAIDYVVSDDLPRLYALKGHGEGELPDTFRGQIEKENMELDTLSLLTVDEVPEDADCVMIYAPESDLSEDEVEMLYDYVEQGGKLFVSAGPVADGALENLTGLLSRYGVETSDGIVVETDRSSYVQAPYFLLPEIQSSTMTDALIEENYYVVFPIAQGMTLTGYALNASVTKLLTTSDGAFSKASGYAMTSFDKEDGDTDGPFTLGVSVESYSGGSIVWFSSSSFLEDAYNSVSSGANVNLAMNALASLVGESEAIAIRSKSLSYNYLTISESAASLLKIVMIGMCPLVYLGFGICMVMRKRRVQSEPV